MIDIFVYYMVSIKFSFKIFDGGRTKIEKSLIYIYIKIDISAILVFTIYLIFKCRKHQCGRYFRACVRGGGRRGKLSGNFLFLNSIYIIYLYRPLGGSQKISKTPAFSVVRYKN